MNKKNILNEIYKDRESEIAVLDEADKQNLEKLLKERERIDKRLEIAISNIPDCFKCTISNINKAIEQKLEIERSINGYFNEKSYVAGFTDIIKFFMRCIEHDISNECKKDKAK